MLELRNVSFRVAEGSKDEEKGILENVSFTLEDNKFVAIILTKRRRKINPCKNYCRN